MKKIWERTNQSNSNYFQLAGNANISVQLLEFMSLQCIIQSTVQFSPPRPCPKYFNPQYFNTINWAYSFKLLRGGLWNSASVLRTAAAYGVQLTNYLDQRWAPGFLILYMEKFHFAAQFHCGWHLSGHFGEALLKHSYWSNKEDLLVQVNAFCEGVGNKDCHYQAIDCYNTRHDNRNDGLHDQLWPHDRHCCNPRATLCCAIRCSQGWKGEEKKPQMSHNKMGQIQRLYQC